MTECDSVLRNECVCYSGWNSGEVWMSSMTAIVIDLVSSLIGCSRGSPPRKDVICPYVIVSSCIVEGKVCLTCSLLYVVSSYVQFEITCLMLCGSSFPQ